MTDPEFQVLSLIRHHQLECEVERFEATDRGCRIGLFGLPRLKFFVDLASLYGVPLDQVTVLADSVGENSTFGDGHHLEIEVFVQVSNVEAGQ